MPTDKRLPDWAAFFGTITPMLVFTQRLESVQQLVLIQRIGDYLAPPVASLKLQQHINH
jgi:hypothetical protein